MEGQRKLFVGGNWKSNLTQAKVKELLDNTINKLNFDENKVEVVISPVSIHIPYVQANLTNKKVQISAQNASKTGFGAFTGEITPQHLTDIGVNWTILGHSERRQYYSETDDIIAEKAKNAITNNVSVIYCIGETLDQREKNQTFEVLKTQLTAASKALQKDQWKHVVVAYEPVWAIGTGKTATPEQAQEAHDYIRKWIHDNVGQDVGAATRVIYGGSVNDKNAADLIKQKDIDGFLVGGASLQPAFTAIVDAANNSS